MARCRMATPRGIAIRPAVCQGEAASVRMSGVKRGLTSAQVGIEFSLGDRADPLGTSRTRILIL